MIILFLNHMSDGEKKKTISVKQLLLLSLMKALMCNQDQDMDYRESIPMNYCEN